MRSVDKMTIEIHLSVLDRLTGKTKLYLDEDELKTMLFFLQASKKAAERVKNEIS